MEKYFVTICILILAISAYVHAEAVSTSEAWLDWSSLTISGNITWTDKGSASNILLVDDYGNGGGSREKIGWVNTSVSASLEEIYGKAYTNNFKLYEEVYVIANELTTSWAWAKADAARYGYFTANSSGWVEFSVDYALSQELLTEAGEWACAWAEARLYLDNEGISEVEDFNELSNELSVADYLTDSAQGTLTISLWFDAGDEGYFEVWASNEVEVEIPEPATICLLALGSLISIGRKKTIVCRKQ